MVVEVNYKDGSRDKYSKVCYAGVLGSRPDCLYIQTRARGIVREVFVRLGYCSCLPHSRSNQVRYQMNKKNMRRVSILVTAQTLGNLEKLAAISGYREIGRVVDKLVREKMISMNPQKPCRKENAHE